MHSQVIKCSQSIRDPSLVEKLQQIEDPKFQRSSLIKPEDLKMKCFGSQSDFFLWGMKRNNVFLQV